MMPEKLHHLLYRQAQKRPEATALVMGSNSMTYGRLDELSNRLANYLVSQGCQPRDRVCLFQPKSLEAVVGMLGVLKAGCIYVPIDTTSPAARISRIVTACAPRFFFLAPKAAGVFDDVIGRHARVAPDDVLSMTAEPIQGRHFESNVALTQIDQVPPARPPQRESVAAHILFTSGSTGTPKGVVITHRNVLCFLEQACRYFGIAVGDRISGHPPLHFDLSTFDIYGSIFAGAELHMVPHEVSLLPPKLAAFIRSSKLQQWFSVPSTLSYMAKFDVVRSGDFPDLKRVLWCGEVLPTPILSYWMERLPHVRFTNLYGPTEATIASSYYTVTECPRDQRVSIPIGSAFEGEELLVLDEDLKPAGEGEIGDLYIRGDGLSPGYFQDEEKTRAAFLPNPSSSDPTDRLYKTGDLARIGDNGFFYFHGRSDSQIKSRGYRIELGEIETALNALPSLREGSVVAVSTEGFENYAIFCAYVPQVGSETTAVQIKKELAEKIPNYMIPSRFKPYGQLPKNANGKIDRRRIKEDFEQDGA